MIRIFKTSLSSSSDSPEGSTAELGQQTSPGRRGFGPKSSGHRSPGGGASILANKRFTLPFLALVAVLAAGLLFLMPGGLLQAQDSTTIEYPENGKNPVATFTATDPEGVTPITWSLATPDQVRDEADLDEVDNADAEDFMIDSEDGVLKFNITEANDGSSPGSPDFENAQGAGDPASNTYRVVVAAADAETGGETGYHKVTVKVTDVAETGKVTWTVDPDGGDTHTPGTPKLMQFQVGASLEVDETDGVTDGDVSGNEKNVTERLQWYRSSSKTAMGTAIDDETEDTYTVTTEDVGMYLRVEAFYNVGTGREESASLTSDYPVLGSRTINDAPEFDPATVTREVSEGDKGMTVGAPVRATDDITNALNYTLGGADAPRFEIDQKTGQIKTLVDLDREGTAVASATTLGSCEGANGTVPDPECTVTVTATDSAGEASDPVATVTIKITNVDEKPTFSTTGNAIGMKMISRDEGMTALADDGAVANVTYMATDPDGLEVNLTLMGADGAKFQLSRTGVLSFREKPDYEKPTDRNNKDNVYEVTVRASDGTMHTDHMVMVTVTDADEGPEIVGKDSFNYDENGKNPVATFTATDPEGVTPITWSLATPDQVRDEADLDEVDNADAEDFMIDSEDGVLKFNITEANDGSSPGSPDFENAQGAGDPASNTYRVVVAAADAETGGETGYHKVTVKVTDVAETGKVTWTTAADGSTPDDPTLVQFQVGSLLTATATDGDISGDTKTVVDANNPTWRWYRGNTRISGDDAEDNTYTVMTEDVGKRLRVTAFYTVGTGREESAFLTSDYPVLGSRTINDAPEFDPATVTREVSEGDKGMTVGAPVRATDDITNALNYTLGGADAPRFEIDQKTGQIKTLVDLDREGTAVASATTLGSCEGANGTVPDPECTVTVTATDSAGEASDPVATVTIKITNVDEKPTFSTTGNAIGMKMISRDEGMTALADDGAVANVTYMATDPDGLRVNLSLMGADEAKFQLVFGGVLSFKTAPDYEMPGDANKDNVYMVTVRASDGTMHTDHMVMVTVTDADEGPEIVEDGLSIYGSSSMYFSEGETDAEATFTARGPMQDMARWTLEGTDARYFRVGTARGAMTELMFRSAPDYEMPRGRAMSDTNTNTYMVTLKAYDGTNMATLAVMVMVTDVDELGTLSGPETVSNYMENSEDPVGTYTVSGGSKSEMANLTLEGDDAGDFSISSAGVLSFNSSPNFEAPMDDGGDNTYMVTVKAMAGGEMDTRDVTVTVTNVEELGTLSGPETVSNYMENSEDAVGTYTVSGGSMSEMANLTLMGDDAGDFMIMEDGMLKFSSPPNFEAPMDMDTDNTYMVTVKAEAGGEMQKVDVTVTVTNMEEDGMVTLSSMTPVVGVELTATLSDPDGMVSGEMWQWSKSMTMDGTFMEIEDAMMMSYTPVDMDDTYYLRATVMYTDGHGPGKMAMATTAMMVTMDAAPMFAEETTTRSVPENTAAGMNIGGPVTATDAGDDTLTYTLGGADAASFDIDPATGQLMTKDMLDFEMPRGQAMSETNTNDYMVTVTATDPEGASDMITVTITVTNEEETGEVTLWAGAVALTMAPQVGETISGAVMDPDGGVMGESWQWARTMTPDMMDSWTDIAGETNAAYMVTAGDTGYYLRVMATYTDAVGTDMAMEYSMPTMMVVAEAEDTLLSRYDENGNGEIDLDEVFTAIDDYFDYDDRLTLEEIYEIVDLYFES